MLRYLFAGACALALVSGPAMAEMDGGTKTVTVTRSNDGLGAHKVITKRHVSPYGHMVTKRIVKRDGFYGSSVARSKTVTDPMTGSSRTRTVIER